jgi:transposase
VELKDINIEETLKEAKELLEQEKDLSPAIKETMNVLILVVHLFANRVGLNSRNSSKPPSTDPNLPKDPPKNSANKPGGQKGHKGETLVINIDRKTLPEGLYTASV